MGVDERPPVWIGHALLPSVDVEKALPWWRATGMRFITSGDGFAHVPWRKSQRRREVGLVHVEVAISIDVDEVGTEAAGATAVIMRESAGDLFLADHPFLFLIRDNQTGSVLFGGRVTDPSTLATPIPEPCAWMLLASGGFIVLTNSWRRRRPRKSETVDERKHEANKTGGERGRRKLVRFSALFGVL